MSILGRIRFKDHAFKLREDAILDAAIRILSSRGFDLMTMDEVAAEVGISKPSLYKHFKSKEELVTEAMVRLLDGALEFLSDLPQSVQGIDRLIALLEWAMRVRLGGGVPFLPSTSPSVRDMLTRNLGYLARISTLNGELKDAIHAAQKESLLRTDLPDDVILFSFYARTCDPAVEFLRIYSKMADDAIVEHMLSVCFDGISGSGYAARLGARQ
jgi:AcrR family transcriptional regulator